MATTAYLDIGALQYPTTGTPTAKTSALSIGAVQPPAATVPVIDSVTPSSIRDGLTGIVIAGPSFGAVQGTVILSPTDDVDDADAVAQTVTAWSDTSITFTMVMQAIQPGTRYVFVITDDDDSNAAGEPVTVQPKYILH